ncbi:zygote arrest protein 1.L-like [Ruditapes philippinarum]|uniref:zygote arrest protein 1.L-like n=1 Tax=Ruditapes philippinarum TaxID=129788 RepID=UPI00295BF04C|nr:zygote arrest protein 1.L-like [Ruditapes philippinarum]
MPRLERKFGFFHCYCQKGYSWTSAHVYCVKNTKKVYYKQMCKQCHTWHNPYRVQNLQCPECGMDVHYCECEFECEYCGFYGDECECVCDDCLLFVYECECDEKESGPDKPHRSDLCGKCLAGFPCHGPRIRRRRRRSR